MSKRRQNTSYPMDLRHAYTVEEDFKILEYVQQARNYGDLTKSGFWMELQDKKLLPNRSWGSMRLRYFKNIRYKSLNQLKNASSSKHSDDEGSESEEDLSEVKRRQVKWLNQAVMDSNRRNNSSYEEDCTSEDNDSKRSKVSTHMKTDDKQDSEELNNSQDESNDSEELYLAEIQKQIQLKGSELAMIDSRSKKDSSSKESSSSSEESSSSSDQDCGSKREEIFLRSKASKVSNQISTDNKPGLKKVSQSEDEDSDSEKESLAEIQKRIHLKRSRKAIVNKCSKEDHSSKSEAKYSLRSRSSNQTTAETIHDSEGDSSGPKVKGDYIYFKRSKLSKLLALTDSEEDSSSEVKGKYIYFKRSELLKLAKTGNKLDSGEDSTGSSDVKGKGVYPKRSKFSKLETTDGESESEGGSSLKRKTTLTPSKKHKETTDKLDNNDTVNDTNLNKESVDDLSTLAEEGMRSSSLNAVSGNTVSPARLANDDTFPPHLSLLMSQDRDTRSDDEMSEVFDVIGNCKEIKQVETEINNNGDSIQVETTSTSLDNEKKVIKNKAKELIEVEGTSALTPDEMMQIDNYLMKQVKNEISNDEQAEDMEPRCPNSQWVVLKKILRVRCRTQATLPQVFFSLFRTNADVNHAIAFLNDKDTKNVWSKKDDKVLLTKDEERIKELIAKRGLKAVQERLKFFELDGCFLLNS